MAPSLSEQFQILTKWVRNSRRKKTTWIVTKGHILKPPFSCVSEEHDRFMEIIVSGKNDSVQCNANKVVNSEFRSGQIGLYVIDSNEVVQQSRIFATLTENYQMILEAFPPNSK